MNRYRIIAGRPIAAPQVPDGTAGKEMVRASSSAPAVAAPINAATQENKVGAAPSGAVFKAADRFSRPRSGRSLPNEPAVAAPINAATQELPAVNSASRMATQGNGYRPKSARDDSTGAVGTTLTTPLRDSAQCPASAAPNELLAIARSWDLWGGAAFVLFVVWMAVSAVFSLQ